MNDTINSSYDLVVVGGGSGGYAAALAGTRLGLSVCLIEESDTLGGNAVRGGVNSWETGAGGTGIPFDLYCHFCMNHPQDIGIHGFGRHCLWHDPTKEAKPFPGGEHLIDPSLTYLDTLQRHGTKGLSHDSQRCRKQWHGLVFEPTTMHQAMVSLLEQSGQCDLRLNTTFKEVHTQDQNITHLTLDDGSLIHGKYFVDGTADGVLCNAAGCELHCGEDPQNRYDEPSAPQHATKQINGVTLIYRITPTTTPGIEPLPNGTPSTCWWQDRFSGTCFVQYPNGDFNVNMLPTIQGQAFLELGYAKAYQECKRRVQAHWHHVQSNHEEFQHYKMLYTAPGLGVRETNRVVCEYMLTERDLRNDVNKQKHPDVIAIADHAMDTHGRHCTVGCAELAHPCGIPLRCLLPVGTVNLLIACRASGFSSLAASSCRLSRTMMQLGQAAGTAVALAIETASSLRTLPTDQLRKQLATDHVTLTWPMPDDLVAYLKHNDPASSHL
ncbi:MAG: FAD-dependent oxidoreductase [Phycisphaeraceae bacterium]|nr:FAD-dependent oxidoreductase [Phycisphaeraceae bacterium]